MSRNEMVQCPFDPNHKVCGARYQYHVTKCKARFPELAKQLKTCPYNARHFISMELYKDHLLNCPDRSVLFREITKGRPVAEVINRPHFGVVREPNDIEHDAALNDEWGYSEFEDAEGSESVVGDDLPTDRSVSRAESVASVATIDLSSVGSKVGAPVPRIYPYSMGIGRCKPLKLEDETPKCCGRAAYRRR